MSGPLKREVPVVWGDYSGPLSQQQLETYRRDGILFFPSLVENIVPDLLDSCRISAENIANVSEQESFIYEEKTSVLRSVYNAHNLDPNFNKLICHPYFLNTARQILGPEIYIHQSHINYKKRFNGENFFWHQDYTFWRDEDGMPSPRAIGVIVFLDEVRIENGPIMYLKGSHLNFYSFINQERNLNANEAARHNYADDLDRNGLINSNIICDISQKGELFTPLGPPGSVVVYDCNLVHASAENLSPFDRCVYLMFYNSCENTLKNPTRPNYISSRNSTPLPLNEV